jgi:mono/diheme cytochrome c family protein
MRLTRISAALLGAAVLAGSGIGYAAEKDKNDIGKREYTENCAVCHGKTGKGDGPYAGLGNTRVSDLTVLSKGNKGVFPFARVYEVIDGRQAVKAHGPRDMPIWGTEYQVKAAEYYMELDYDPNVYVRARILALIDYLNRLQAK